MPWDKAFGCTCPLDKSMRVETLLHNALATRAGGAWEDLVLEACCITLSHSLELFKGEKRQAMIRQR